MEILRFRPIFKTLVWGGEKIAPYKGVETTQDHIGESWELSGVAGDESVVDGGRYDGRTIGELCSELKGELLGEGVYARTGAEFPLLIKFIDARSDLSIQVHPDDRLAAERHGAKGKTEMWYVVGADEDASLYAGLTASITPEEYEKRVADNTITDVLARHDVAAGDVFFLPAGRIHAICAGSFIAEIQQTSNITYRIWDYGRKGLDGKPRELHTELAKDAIDYTVHDDYRTHYENAKDAENLLVGCEYFTTSLFDLTRPFTKDLSALDSFLVVICIGGSGTVAIDGSEVAVRQGKTVLIPASATKVTFTPDDAALRLITSHC